MTNTEKMLEKKTVEKIKLLKGRSELCFRPTAPVIICLSKSSEGKTYLITAGVKFGPNVHCIIAWANKNGAELLRRALGGWSEEQWKKMKFIYP